MLLVLLVRREARSGGHGPGWGGAGSGAAEELSPGWGFRSVWWRRTTVSGEEKPLHTLGSLRKGEKKAGAWGVASLLVQFPGVCPPSRHEGKPQPPPIGAAPLFPFLYLPVLHLQAVCFGSSPDSKTQSSFSRSFSRLFTIPEGTLIFFSL